MGWTSEMVALTYKVSREKQDAFALISHTRAENVSTLSGSRCSCSSTSCIKASKAGIFAEEIVPIELREKTISVDDTIRPGVTAESLQKLKPVFPDWGKAFTTAGNASGVGDGAAICILTTRERAQREGMEILGKFVASTFVGKYLRRQLQLRNLSFT